jgi:hypothetical protein
VKTTALETAVIEAMLADRELPPHRKSFDVAQLLVASRDMTGAGFLTQFASSTEAVRAFEPGVSLRWGKVGARINDERMETSYVVYVDDGWLNAIEGYTYGDEWPANVDRFEVYPLKFGVDLEKQ